VSAAARVGPRGPEARVPGALESRLRARRGAGAKLLVPYITGGMGDDWLDAVHAVADAGADAIEIGIPFSDPVMDGPTIQEASVRALVRGTTPTTILAALSRTEIGVPLAVMTYYNLVFRAGHKRFADALVGAGVVGAIVPDLPLEEAGGWSEEADAAGIETVFLVAPSTPDERARRICERSRGFVYGVGLMGVTGERTELASSAREVAGRLRPMTDTPVCIGIGVSTPDQAADVCSEADGVVVGSALVRRLLDGAGPEGAAAFVAALRAGIDAGR
jgi:tryptophan synthase alpha chain